LIHGDATDLKFPDESFDGYWSVQTLQHVVCFETALNEARRVLKGEGIFANYSLNDGAAIRWLYRIAGRHYVKKEWVEGYYWMARASCEQRKMLESIFATKVSQRWSEIFYKPELRITFPGREYSWLGHLDAVLSNDFGFLGFLARQRSFHCRRP
jgi:ubiquinone/menaquinone biosynthesis C-methylase UbiE